jgi:hypothetical protein
MDKFKKQAIEYINNKDAYKPTPPFSQQTETSEEDAEAQWTSQPDDLKPSNSKTTTNTTSQRPPPASKTYIFGDRNESYSSKQQRYEHARAADMKEQDINERSKYAWEGLKQFRKDHFTNIITTADPPQVHIENFYKAIEASMKGHRMPIVNFQNLTPTSTCRPIDEPLAIAADNAISQTLYQKLSASIPDYCTTLTSLKNTYSLHQDGYAALFSIMRYSCSFLQQLRPPFGPTWYQGTIAFDYLTELNTFLDEQRRHNTFYTPYEIAAEILQRAAELPDYSLLATTQLTRLQTQDVNQDVDISFTPHELVTILESHRASKLKNIQPMINKMHRGGNFSRDSRDNRDKRDDHKDSKPGFKYKNEVQCKMCHNFGHDIDAQVCRAGAQHYHCMNYCTLHKDTAKANAKAYSVANNVTKISKMINQHPTMFNPNSTQEEINDQILDFARCMNVESSDEEAEE